MTKKHFAAVAAHLREIEPEDTRANVAKGLATVFLTLNPRFNRTLFLKACNVEE